MTPGRRSRIQPIEPGPETTVAPRWVAWLMVLVMAGSLAVLPTIVSPGRENMFRLIKELALRVEAVLAVLLVVSAVAFAGTARLREMLRERAVVILLAGTLVWTVVVTFFSTNRPLSTLSLVDVVCAAAVFFMVWYATPSVPPRILDVVLVASAANAILVMLQAYDIWQPFTFALRRGTRLFENTALIGNPNDVGGYLALTAVVLCAVAATEHGWRTSLYGVGALVAAAGVIASQARSAVATLSAGLLMVAFRRSWKAGLTVTVLLAMTFGLAFSQEVRVFVRIADAVESASAGDWTRATSARSAPLLAAYEMFRAHPLTGVGPGVFRYHYVTYATKVAETHEEGVGETFGTNFGNAHNDHAQLLAETGLPGFVLFVVALLLLARGGRSNDATDVRARIATLLGLPFAVALAVLCIAQFPLHLAVTRHLIVTIAALVVGWRRL